MNRRMTTMARRRPRRLLAALVAGAALVAALGAGCGQKKAKKDEAKKQIDDQDITRAVETELILDDAVASHLVDVQTTDGIVTLSGSVDNILGRDRAVAIARAVKGVRSVVNKTEVSPAPRTDEEIRQDVLAALATDPAADSYELDVAVSDGVVTLTGVVDSWQEKELSGQVAKGVRGVKDLVNRIDVEYETERSDAEIKAEVRRRLDTDVLVDAGLIDVTVQDGEVDLTGTVGSAAERARASADAWVAGVQSVDSSGLEIQWWARDEMKRKEKDAQLTDEKIEQAIRDAFLYDPRVFSFQPQVEVEDGVVTLSGTVGSVSAKRAAGETARNTHGVWRLRNLLRVRPETRPADDVLAERVRDALQRDPYVERHEVTVSVLNGKAYLYGAVDNRFEKSQATRVASGVDGVVEVRNSLTVAEEWTWKDDLEIQQDVQQQVGWSPYVDAGDVTVTVTDGTVTLTGVVDSWYERRKAAENAWEGGARDVRNLIEVKPEES
ncbi:MAG: BON domain-containing protein [bacterium]